MSALEPKADLFLGERFCPLMTEAVEEAEGEVVFWMSATGNSGHLCLSLLETSSGLNRQLVQCHVDQSVFVINNKTYVIV